MATTSSGGRVLWVLRFAVSSGCCATQHMSNHISQTSFGHCSIMNSRTLNLHNRVHNAFFTSEDPVVCYSSFPSELSSDVGYHKPWLQGEVITKKKLLESWFSITQGVQVAEAKT